MSKPYPWKCGTCLERGLIPVRIDYETTRIYDGQQYTLRIPAVAVLKCEKCGAIVLDDTADDRIYEALRRATGILKPDEIRRNREAVGLTQVQLGELVYEHEATVARWETGGQIQNRPMDLLLRLLFKFPDVRRELGSFHTANGTTKEPPVLVDQRNS